MLSFFLSVTFVCGLVIAGAHLANRKFIAPVYDVVLNLTAFASATCASSLLHDWVPASLSACAVGAWVLLALRTVRALRAGLPLTGQTA